MIDRKKFIGGSEIAACCGMSRWKTQLELWAEKTGRLEPKDLSENESVEWGHRLEEPVAKKFSDTHKVKLMAYKKRFYHKEHGFLSCELDRIITGTDEFVECKTCDARLMKEWEDDEIPIDYIMQVQFDLGITGRKKAWIAVLIGGNRYRERELEFDQELYDMMIEKACEFWDMVQNDVPPIAVAGDKETLGALYPGEESTVMEFYDEILKKNFDIFAENREKIKGEIKKFKNEKERLENRIKAIMENCEIAETDKYEIKWKTQKTTPKTNYKAMKEDGVFNKYCEQGETRVLRIKEKKS
jgi:putative phage-type endonuclease